MKPCGCSDRWRFAVPLYQSVPACLRLKGQGVHTAVQTPSRSRLTVTNVLFSFWGWYCVAIPTVSHIGKHAVGQREVHDAVLTAEGHRRFCCLFVSARASASHVHRHHAITISFCHSFILPFSISVLEMIVASKSECSCVHPCDPLLPLVLLLLRVRSLCGFGFCFVSGFASCFAVFCLGGGFTWFVPPRCGLWAWAAVFLLFPVFHLPLWRALALVVRVFTGFVLWRPARLWPCGSSFYCLFHGAL